MKAAYLEVDSWDFHCWSENLYELKQGRKLPHVPYLVQQFVLLRWCGGFGGEHLVVCPLPRHDG